MSAPTGREDAEIHHLLKLTVPEKLDYEPVLPGLSPHSMNPSSGVANRPRLGSTSGRSLVGTCSIYRRIRSPPESVTSAVDPVGFAADPMGFLIDPVGFPVDALGLAQMQWVLP